MSSARSIVTLDPDREKILATILLLNLINTGEATVTLHYKGSPPGTLTQQTLDGFGAAAMSLRIVHAITEEEIKDFTDLTLRNPERGH